jgi:hypothetical protein
MAGSNAIASSLLTQNAIRNVTKVQQESTGLLARNDLTKQTVAECREECAVAADFARPRSDEFMVGSRRWFGRGLRPQGDRLRLSAGDRANGHLLAASKALSLNFPESRNSAPPAGDSEILPPV